MPAVKPRRDIYTNNKAMTPEQIDSIVNKWAYQWKFNPITVGEALKGAITEATTQLAADNKTLLNAQKTCDDCDAPTMGQFRKLTAENAEHILVYRKISKEISEISKAKCNLMDQVQQLQSQLAKQEHQQSSGYCRSNPVSPTTSAESKRTNNERHDTNAET
jgi:hypothetical protein